MNPNRLIKKNQIIEITRTSKPESSGNSVLIEMIHSVNDRAKLSKLRRNSYQHGTMRISLQGHREIIDLLRKHDSENAAKKMGEHGRALFNDLSIRT